MKITWRPATLHDATAIAAVVNASLELGGSHELVTAQSVREELAGPFWTIADDTVVAEQGGTIVAYGGVIAPVQTGTNVRCRATVHPDHRGLGLGTELLSRMLARARELHAGVSVPWSIRQGSEDGDESAGKLLRANGFEPVRFWFEMHRDLEDVASPADVDGLELRALRAGDTEALYEAHRTAFADHWGNQDRGLDIFRTRVTDASAFRPSLSRVAVEADGSVAGYVLAFVEADPDIVQFGLIGTRREWRGRGVASELVRRSLAAAREQGMSSAALMVDGDSPTGAVGVYERLGFEVVGRSTTYELALS